MTKEIQVQHRELDSTIEDLRSHLQAELDYFNNLPLETTLRDLMESHFERGA